MASLLSNLADNFAIYFTKVTVFILNHVLSIQMMLRNDFYPLTTCQRFNETSLPKKDYKHAKSKLWKNFKIKI